MKRLILIFVGLGMALLMNAQFPAQEGYRHYKLIFDTINILPSDNVYKVSIYVDDASTDSCTVTGKISTLDDIAASTIPIAPGQNYTVGNAWNRRLDSLTIISRDGCKAFITTLEK